MKVEKYYFEFVKALAKETREQFGLRTARVTVSDLRRIYRTRNIHIDLWPHKFKRLTAAYFNDELGRNVLIPKGVSGDCLVFLLAHGLKHHLLDSGSALTCCISSDECSVSERSADFFACELIYPGNQFESDLRRMGIGPRNGSEAALARLGAKRERHSATQFW